MTRKKYYLIGSLLLVIILIGYHYYAASEAEQQIDETIQKAAAKNESLSAQYSSIEVAPFGAALSIRDLTIIFGDHVERTQHLQLDINYLDLLNIYIGGLTYGLDNLKKAEITAVKPSYINRSGLKEIKLDTLNISYRGNLLDGLTAAVNGTSFTNGQSIEAESSGLTIQLPNTTLSKLKAKEFRYSGNISAGQQHFWTNGNHQLAMDSLTWTPSESFQNTYRFFIEGFGYSSEAIPFQKAQLHSTPVPQSDVLKIESSVRSDLALFSGSGFVKLNNPIGNSALQKTKIRITDLSETFRNVLSNLERLLSVTLPRENEGITINISGTLAQPKVIPPAN